MLKRILNIGQNAFRRQNFRIMAGKVLIRIKENAAKVHLEDVRNWCQNHSQPCDDFLRTLEADLWAETLKARQSIETAAQKKLQVLGLDLGGGGNYPMLYFFTRYLKPKTVVETGVAAGWSSQAILSALKVNGGGSLYSSDFPYFRYKDPEKLVGYIVDEDLKDNWTLCIDGDKNNLPVIAAQCGSVDLFHYDSDKSYEGRVFAIQKIAPLLTDNSLVIFDDIQDNFHFRDYMKDKHWPMRVFEFGGKFIGLTGPALQRIVSDAKAA